MKRMPGIVNFSAEVPQLSPGEVHVWFTPLTSDRNGVTGRSTVFCESHSWNLADLSEDERERADRFASERDRVRYVATRSILRRLLGAYLNLAPSEIRFSYGAFGKPELRSPFKGSPATGHCTSRFAIGETATAQLRFNLSHAGGWAAYAVSRDRDVGIDIEPLQNDVPWQDLAPLIFSPNERAEFHRIPPCEKAAAFLRRWTRKEAYVKGRGEGLSLSLNAFDVPLGSFESTAPVEVLDAKRLAFSWRLYPLDPIEGFVSALAVKGPPARINVCRWEAMTRPVATVRFRESGPVEFPRAPVSTGLKGKALCHGSEGVW